MTTKVVIEGNTAHIVKYHKINNSFGTWCELNGERFSTISDTKMPISELPKEMHICKNCVQVLTDSNFMFESDNKTMHPIVNSYINAFENCRAHSPAAKENKRMSGRREDGCYDFIPMKPMHIVRLLRKAINALDLKNRQVSENPVKFLDVGCGAGNVMLLAATMLIAERRVGYYYRVEGIEYDEYYADLAKKLAGQQNLEPRANRIHVFNQNAFSFEDYGNYDIIYYWCPIDTVEEQKALEKLIEKQMKSGAILIPLMKRDGTLRKSKKFKIVNPQDRCCEPIYKKVK